MDANPRLDAATLPMSPEVDSKVNTGWTAGRFNRKFTGMKKNGKNGRVDMAALRSKINAKIVKDGSIYETARELGVTVTALALIGGGYSKSVRKGTLRKIQRSL